MLAQELDVSKTALYRHFESKQALTTAMKERFFDDFADALRPNLEKALKTDDADMGILIIIEDIGNYFAKNVYHLIFSLANIYDRNLDKQEIAQNIKNRGTDLEILNTIAQKKYNSTNDLFRLIFATLTFYMAHFHFHEAEGIKNCEFIEGGFIAPAHSDEKIKNIIDFISQTISKGLDYPYIDDDRISFEKLEALAEGVTLDIEEEPLFKAVAEAVAEAAAGNYEWRKTAPLTYA